MRSRGIVPHLLLTGAIMALSSAALASAFPPDLTLRSKDGSSSITFSLVAQLRVEYDNMDKGSGQEREDEAFVHFRRIRPIIKGSLITQDLTYLLHLNIVPGSLELIDLYINYAFLPQVQLLLGQAKIPFTRYRIDSFKDLPVVEWSNPTRFFGAERQIGAMFHNGWNHPPPLEYELGVYTGVNARASNGIGIAKAFGETVPNPSDLADPALPAEFHPELVAHLAYNLGGIDVRVPSDLEGGPPRLSVGVSGAWDIRPTPGQDHSLRLAPEFLLKSHGFSLLGIFYLTFWEKEDSDLTSTSLAFLGAVAQASQVFLERYEIALRYTLVYFTDGLREETRLYADNLIAAEADPVVQDELAAKYKSLGLVTAEHEITLGFNVYFFDRFLKWQTDGSLRYHERVDGDRMDAVMRSQLQMAF